MSTMPTYPNYIACAMLAGFTLDENKRRLTRAMAMADALGVPYVVVKGAYDGSPETSLNLYGPMAFNAAQVLAIAFEQETFLEIDSYHIARLRDQTGKIVQEFGTRVDGTADNYTEDSLGNRYTFV